MSALPSLSPDPSLEPGVPTVVARRTLCGPAMLWQPGSGDVKAFAEFVGDGLVPVGDVLYERRPDGSLVPFDTSREVVVVKPAAGDLLFLSPAELRAQFVAVSLPVGVSPDAEVSQPAKRGPGRPRKVADG